MARPWYDLFQDFFSRRRLWLFPLVSGSAWFATLSVLLVRWVAIGRPEYPGQVNPWVPFISDIAAQTFKPAFVAGCALTGAGFFGTVFAVHHVRYSPRFYALAHDAPWRQAVSLVALVFGLLAAFSLLFLAIFDTDDAHREHRYLLMSTFACLFVSAATTTVVWWDQTRGPIVFKGLRKWCILNDFLVLCQFVLGTLMVTFMYTGYYRWSGILEWVLCYVGSFWILSFVGYVRFRPGEEPKAEDVDERRPLLA
ncbi:hypothetical protein F4780DRAFT_225280 [Xylariomycetidae sp. FL0641]|nr:hypothetical protein F4780DRAFT_225280 [Xylariomycetidae sp. FL0641]